MRSIKPIGDDVLEQLRLFVNFVPAEAHDLDEEQLDEPMAPQDECGEPLAGARQRDPGVRLVFTSPDSASVLTIVVAVPGVTPNAAASWPIGSRRGSDPCGAGRTQINGLEIVLDRAGRQHGFCQFIIDF